MNHTLAKIISVVLHPLLIFVALYAFLLSQRQFHISTLSMMRHDSFLIVLLTIATILCILLFYKLKWIKTLTLSDSHDRLIAYLCFIVELCIVINLNLIDKNMNPVLFLMISILLNALISILVITIFWKISAHTFFIGTAIGFLLAIHPYCTFNAVLLFPILFILAGIAASARLQLNAHSIAQIYVGFLLGLFEALLSTSIIL